MNAAALGRTLPPRRRHMGQWRHNKAAPGGASTPLVRGPRRLTRRRLMVNGTPPRAPNGGAS